MINDASFHGGGLAWPTKCCINTQIQSYVLSFYSINQTNKPRKK